MTQEQEAKGVNLFFIVLAIAGCAIGAYGFLFGGPASPVTAIEQQHEPLLEPIQRPSAPLPRNEFRPPQRDGRMKQSPHRISESEVSAARCESATSLPGDATGTPAVAAQPPSELGTASIRGKVVDERGKPRAGVTIRALRSGLMDKCMLTRYDGIGQLEQVLGQLRAVQHNTREALTDADGAFIIENLVAAHTYDVVAIADGKQAVFRSQVAAGDTLLLALSCDFEIRGKVIFDGSASLPPFKVCVRASNSYWRTGAERAFDAPDGGLFRMGVSRCAGQYEITVSADGFYLPKSVKVYLSEEAPFADVELVMKPAASLAGILKSTQGFPLNGAKIELMFVPPPKDGETSIKAADCQWPSELRKTIDSLGRYRYDSLVPGKYRVRGSMIEEETLTLESGNTCRDFTVDVKTLLTIGAKNEDGDPMPVSSLSLMPKKNKAQEVSFLREFNFAIGLSRVFGMAPDEYTLRLDSPGYVTVQKDVTIAPGTNSMEVVFSKGCTLTGMLTLPPTFKTSMLSIQLAASGDADARSVYVAVAQEESNRYTIGPVSPGSWTLKVWNDRGTSLYKSSVMLGPGKNTHDIVLSEGGTLTVTFLETEDALQKCRYGTVYISNAEAGSFSAYVSDSKERRCVVFTQVPPGEYKMSGALGSGELELVCEDKTVFVCAGANCEETLTVRAPNCVKVTRVKPGSREETARLCAGDLIIEYHGQSITDKEQLNYLTKAAKNEARIALVVMRSGTRMSIEMPGGSLDIAPANALR